MPGCCAAARRGRARRGQRPGDAAEPGTVDYARSFFPVCRAAGAALLPVRALPHPVRFDDADAADGDFILVNKFAYGLRLPVTNSEVPGDRRAAARRRVVFRFPPDPRSTTSSASWACRATGRGARRSADHQWRAGAVRSEIGALLGRLLRQHAAGGGAARRARAPGAALPDPDCIAVSPLPGCNRDIDAELCLQREPARRRRARGLGATTTRCGAGGQLPDDRRQSRQQPGQPLLGLRARGIGRQGARGSGSIGTCSAPADRPGAASASGSNELPGGRQDSCVSRQRGITFIGWLFLLMPVAIVVYGGIRLAPVYLNYMKVAKAHRTDRRRNTRARQTDPGS